MESTKCTSNMIVPVVLTEDNYEVWKIFMKSYLIGKGLWDIVEGSECKPEPTNPEFKAWRMRNGEALHAILISCGEKVLFFIREKDLAKDAWDHLASKFQQNSKGKNKLLSEAETNILEESKSVSKAESNRSEENKFRSKGETNFLQKQIMPSHARTSSVGQEEMAAANIDAGYLHAVFRAVYSSDWKTIKSLLLEYPLSISAIISPFYGTVLHVAVRNGNLQLVNHLLEFMTPHDIETIIKNCHVTPLYVAACCGFTKIAEALVGKHGHSLEIPGNRGYFPVVVACANSRKDMTRYLYEVTRKEALIQENGIQGATLINLAIKAEMYDIAIELLHLCPRLSITIDLLKSTTIRWLSWKPNAFASGGHHSIWQQWIYSIPGIKSIHNKKEDHVKALEVLKIVCSQLSSLDEPTFRELEVHNSLFSAVELGIVEIVSELAKINPDLLSTKRTDGMNILSIAIVHRQEKVFNFLCGKVGLLDDFLLELDHNRNNSLHHAGMLSSVSDRHGKMAGAALQMQRELQWFQEVEEIGQSQDWDLTNKDGLTPRELFTKEHRELVKKGEKWMKDTANSCMIVATLIATVTFAAAFTVPGGNNQELGFPIFLRRKLFLLFIISDALSLFSSSTSVLMFLSIYTSRYAEEDFLKSLPKRLIIGLSTLFFSIATMMVAFCATMFLILGKHYKWAAILITFLGSVPVTLFILLQFPLFLDMILSTYGPGLFSRKGKKDLYMLVCSAV